MGHLARKDVFRCLGEKMDGLHVRTPWNETFHTILEELLSQEEADIIVKMPYVLSNVERVAAITRMSVEEVQPVLQGLCEKGFVMDVFLDHEYRYMPNPMVIGWFEFTMMRTRGELRTKVWAQLFHEYMSEGTFYQANFNENTQVSIARALPHGESIGDHVEVLNYEKAQHLIDEAGRYAIGYCSCRHKKDHAEGHRCDVPLETCTTFGHGADYIVRHGMGREVSKSEVQDVFARSRDLGLVFCADNVQRNALFVCHCCGCCCGIMDGLNVHGLPKSLVTSTLIAEVDTKKCAGCEQCAGACPVQAIELQPRPDSGAPQTRTEENKLPVVDKSFCIGCGVCGLNCPTGAIRLAKRKQRVIHPETTFERVILQCLERGTLHNQLFDDPQSLTQKVMRPLVGGFLRLEPVKKALMSDMLRSRFLKTMASGITILGKGYIHEM